jgi:hypothetical protein
MGKTLQVMGAHVKVMRGAGGDDRWLSRLARPVTLVGQRSRLHVVDGWCA